METREFKQAHTDRRRGREMNRDRENANKPRAELLVCIVYTPGKFAILLFAGVVKHYDHITPAPTMAMSMRVCVCAGVCM